MCNLWRMFPDVFDEWGGGGLESTKLEKESRSKASMSLCAHRSSLLGIFL